MNTKEQCTAHIVTAKVTIKELAQSLNKKQKRDLYGQRMKLHDIKIPFEDVLFVVRPDTTELLARQKKTGLQNCSIKPKGFGKD